MNVTSYWNNHASQYHFSTTTAALSGSTFGQAYNGSDFNQDFAAILRAVGFDTNSTPPILGSDDVLVASLENWPG